MSKKKPQSRIQGRSSITGEFVKPAYVKNNPSITQNERLPLPGKGTSKKK